jgi:hypothetical protein
MPPLLPLPVPDTEAEISFGPDNFSLPVVMSSAWRN